MIIQTCKCSDPKYEANFDRKFYLEIQMIDNKFQF
mgnify:CR=1 FL=1